MNTPNASAEIFSSDASNLNLLQFEKLFSCLKEFSNDGQSLNKTIVSLEDQMFLKLPSLWLRFSFEVEGQFLFEFSKCRAEVIENFESDNHFVKGFFNFNLGQFLHWFFCYWCYSLAIEHWSHWRHYWLTPIHQYWVRSECHLLVFIQPWSLAMMLLVK